MRSPKTLVLTLALALSGCGSFLEHKSDDNHASGENPLGTDESGQTLTDVGVLKAKIPDGQSMLLLVSEPIDVRGYEYLLSYGATTGEGGLPTCAYSDGTSQTLYTTSMKATFWFGMDPKQMVESNSAVTDATKIQRFPVDGAYVSVVIDDGSGGISAPQNPTGAPRTLTGCSGEISIRLVGAK